MSNEKVQKQWFDYGFFILIFFPILTFFGLILGAYYYEETVPAEEISQLSPELKNKIKEEIKSCEKRDYAVTWIKDPMNKPYTRLDIYNLKVCLQYESEGREKIVSDMNAYYDQKRALENQINSAK